MSNPGKAAALHDAAMLVRAQDTVARKVTTQQLVAHLRGRKTAMPGYAEGIAEAIDEISNAPPQTSRPELASRLDELALRALSSE